MIFGIEWYYYVLMIGSIFSIIGGVNSYLNYKLQSKWYEETKGKS